MSDIVKWGLLGAGVVLLIGLVSALPFVDFINFTEFSAALNNIIDSCSGFLVNARRLINCFLLPSGRTILSGLLVWLFGKWAILISIKTVAWVYHFVFRG